MCEMKLKVFIFVVFLDACAINAFNLSPVPNLIIQRPNIPTLRQQKRSSYFGFSIVLRENSVIIGAPRAESTLITQVSINETGAIYKCNFNFNQALTAACAPFVFEADSNRYYTDHRYNEVRDFQWLGGAMDGGSKDSDPLLVCAPRFDGGERWNEADIDYLHGICYRSTNTLRNAPSNVVKFKPLTTGQQIANKGYHFQMGQMGFSAHVTPNNKEYLMGAPGIDNWSGSVVRFNERTQSFNIPTSLAKNELTLTGYAVASGYLNSWNINQLYYVTTAPHENVDLGQAFIFEYDTDNAVKGIYATFQGTQYCEYYGYAALVVDINGDKLDDIVITAPQYRIEGTIDIGAIYVYINMRSFNFQRQTIEAPFKTEARFGTTITNLGDINHDGYNDIAVGAPLALDNGAVVIYLGGPHGLQTKPSQIISLPTSLGTTSAYFGHGLSKGVDIDRNRYNDLAIGAPNSESVYIYRTYPVMGVITTITVDKQNIDLETERIQYHVCFRTDSHLPTPLLMNITADAKIQRITFDENSSNRLQLRVLAMNFEKCHILNATLTFLSSQVFAPIETMLTHYLEQDGMRQTGAEFCTTCAVLDPRAPNTSYTVMKYKHGCENDVCNADLSIESVDLPIALTIGNLESLTVTYNITNHGEKAFDTQVTITNSLNLPFARIPTNCFESANHVMNCEIAKGIGFLETNEKLEISFDLSNLTNANDITITAKVSSLGKELRSEDNTVVDKIDFQRYCKLEVIGYPNETLLLLDDSKTALDIEYIYTLQNLGPSDAENLEIFLQVPSTLITADFRRISYINLTDAFVNVVLDDQLINVPHTIFNISTENVTENTSNEDTYTSKIDSWYLKPMYLPPNRTIFQYCNQTTATICTASNLKLPELQSGKSLTIKLKVSLDVKEVKQALEDPWDRLAIFLNITLSNTASQPSFFSIKELLTPIAVQRKKVPKTPLWIYIAAVVSGLLLLTVITLSFWKLGFFKRQSKEDMQKLLNEKIDTERLNSGTDMSCSNNNMAYDDIQSTTST